MRKIFVMILVTLLYFSCITMTDFNLTVKASSEEDNSLDTQYIYSITKALSDVIYIYNETELAKGREFGSKGELYAADLIANEMKYNLSLYDPTSNPYLPHLQRLQNLSVLEYPIQIFSPWINLITKIDVIEKGLTITNKTDPNNTTTEKITDFYISPYWNESVLNILYNKNLLTYNLSYENLSIINIPTEKQYFTTANITWFEDFISNTTIINIITNDTSVYNLSNLLNLTKTLFEDYYNFTFENLNPYNNNTWPIGFQRYDTNETDDYVMIEEDSKYNPFGNSIRWTPPKEYDNQIVTLLCSVWPKFSSWLWYKTNTHCKGIIRYDTDNLTYNMNLDQTTFPYICINGTIGKPINQTVTNYNITYYINQEYNDSIESYNVIGQINGTDPTKTVIISCLYDCLWNQGTSDAAIGMAIVLAIAKYMKKLETDYNIKPKYNVKFVGFGGEEYMRGAFQYLKEAKENNENITTIIDLNQLGFNTTLLGYDPEADYYDIRLELWTNKLITQPFLTYNGKITEYTERTGNITPLETLWNLKGGRPGNYQVFSMHPSLSPKPNTIYILKMGNWKYHHRDGIDHTEGDSFKYYDDNDVNISAELIFNITKLYTINPDTWLENEDYELIDSPDDNNDEPDMVNVSFDIKTIMPLDRVTVRAILYSTKHPMIHKYIEERNYTITRNEGISDIITVKLPEYAPSGEYQLKLLLYNSTGATALNYFHNIDINFTNMKLYDTLLQIFESLNNHLKEPLLSRLQNIANWIFNNKISQYIFDQLYYMMDYYFDTPFNLDNDSYKPEPFNMYPNNDPPNKPTTPTGPTIINAGTSYNYTTNTTDPNNDTILYQWDWRANKIIHSYSLWNGPYDSGESYTQQHTWLQSDTDIQVRVRAKNNRLNPNVYSDWSDPLNITIQPGCNIQSPDIILNGQSTYFYGQLYDIQGECNYTWNFGESIGVDNTTQNASHVYSNNGYRIINFTATDNSSNSYYYEKQVNIVDLKSDYTTNTIYSNPNNTITFTNNSQGNYDIVNHTWDFDDGNISYEQNTNHSYEKDGEYNVTLTVKDTLNNTAVYTKKIYIDSVKPQIISTICTPDIIGVGMNITINADFNDNSSNIKNATVNITRLDGTSTNYSMYTNNDSFYDYMYVFNNTNSSGMYFYNIWMEDNSGNTHESYGHCFIVSNLFGYTEPGDLSQDTSDRITGTVFTCYENCTADNISAYVYAPECMPTKKSKCMIYRADDSTRIGTTEELTFMAPGEWKSYNFQGEKPNLIKNTNYILVFWSNGTSLYYDTTSLNVGRYNETDYTMQPPNNTFFLNESRIYSIYCCYTPQRPGINNVTNNPEEVGFGFNVTISADIVDEISDVEQVIVNITYPDSTYCNYTMNNTINDTYMYVFNYTWQTGQYNYSILAFSIDGANSSSATQRFDVSAEATINLATLQDDYTDDEYINITDPPNPAEQYLLVDRGLTWDEYYNTQTGNNILKTYTGPINYKNETNDWTPINQTLTMLSVDDPAYNYGYRMGNKQGLYNVYFKPQTQQDWPVVFSYNKSNQPTVDIIRTKLVGVGYLDPSQNWAYEYLQNIQNSQGYINDNAIVYENAFTGTNLVYSYGNVGLKEEIIMSNTTKNVLNNHPPSDYGLSDNDSYLVFITCLDIPGLSMHNKSGLLNGNTTIFDGRVEFKDVMGRVKCILPLGNAYEYYNDSNQFRLVYRILQYNDNYYLLSGLKTSVLNNMSFPVIIDPTLNLEVLENDGYCYQISSKYDEAWEVGDGEVDDTDPTILIGQQKSSGEPTSYNINRGFLFFNTTGLPSNAIIQQATLSLHKAADYSTTDFDIIVQNGQPEHPNNPIQGEDYNKDLYDGFEGKFNTNNFTDGFNNLTISNFSWLNNEGLTKLCLRSMNDIDGTEPTGDEYISIHSYEYPSVYCHSMLEIVFKNQSKIKNTGSTNISGYLLIQVQYYNSTLDEWVVDNDTINETTPRIINSSEQLALDLIFNGLVNTNDLTFDDGLYRVYACFRNPNGDILICDDENLLEASYEFDINFA